MFNFSSTVAETVWKVFRFLSTQQMPELHHCTLYGRKFGTYNETTVLNYICYGKQVCCDRGNGCCPINKPNKNTFFGSWGFWLVILGGILLCYFLVWMCKKFGKNYQTTLQHNEDNGDHPRNLRSVQYVNRVDRFLEDLIQNCRNRLATQRNTVENLDEVKVDKPPEYKDALNMPKPQKPETNRETVNGAAPQQQGSEQVNNAENDNKNEVVPTYEDAIKKL